MVRTIRNYQSDVLRPGSPWWLEEVLRARGGMEAAPPLVGAQTCDVMIVGAGYTGLWTALSLKERRPELQIVIIESSVVGAGPSGRNGGIMSGYAEQFPALVRNLGLDAAKGIVRAGSKAQAAIIEFVERNQLDVWLRKSGIIMVATSASQERAVDEAIMRARDLGGTHTTTPLSRQDLRNYCTSSALRKGILYPDAATVQPARLVRALRDAVIAAGVRLYESSPLESLQRNAGQLRARTPLGEVTCGDVVLATGSALARHPVGRNYVTNLSSYMILTEPIPDLLREMGWQDGPALRDARMFLHWSRTTQDGRIVFGTGAGPMGFAGREKVSDVATVRDLADEFRRVFPELSSVCLTDAWAGPVDMASDHIPVCGKLQDERVHFAFGFSGHGISATWIAGQVLASSVEGADDEWSRLALRNRRVPKLPPEPFRYIGGQAIKHSIMRVEDAGDAALRAPLWARVGADLPHRLGLRIGTRR